MLNRHRITSHSIYDEGSSLPTLKYILGLSIPFDFTIRLFGLICIE